MKYPIGIQSFESLINDGYIYVDKTALIYQLVLLLPKPPTEIRKESAHQHTGSLLQRTAGTIQGTGNRTA